MTRVPINGIIVPKKHLPQMIMMHLMCQDLSMEGNSSFVICSRNKINTSLLNSRSPLLITSISYISKKVTEEAIELICQLASGALGADTAKRQLEKAVDFFLVH
jgi:hypothetical protein